MTEPDSTTGDPAAAPVDTAPSTNGTTTLNVDGDVTVDTPDTRPVDSESGGRVNPDGTVDPGTVPAPVTEEQEPAPDANVDSDTTLPLTRTIPIESVATVDNLPAGGATAIESPEPYEPGVTTLGPAYGNPTTPELSEPTQKSLDVLEAMGDGTNPKRVTL